MQYSNIAQPQTTLKLIYPSLKFDQDKKQVSREAIHIRWNNLALSQNIGKLNIPKIFNQILGIIHNTSADVFKNSTAQQKPLPVKAIEPLGLLIYMTN